MNQQKQNIETFFSAAPAGFCILDSKLRYIHINEAMADINGLSVEAHLGKAIAEVLPNLGAKIEPVIQSVLDTGKPVVNIDVSGETLSKPGIVRHWVVSYFLARDGKEDLRQVGALVLEITHRKHEEVSRSAKWRRKRWKSEERWRSLAENAPDFMTVVDRKGKILFVNRILPGNSWKRISGKNIFEYFSSEQKLHIETALKNIFQKGEEEYIYEALGMRASGEKAWYRHRFGAVKFESRVVAGVFFTTDITDRKQAEEILHESEKQYRFLFEKNVTPMWVFDRETRQFLAVNETAIERYGYSREEFLKLSAKDIRSADEIVRFESALSKLPLSHDLVVPVNSFAGSLRHRTKDGRILYVEVSWTPITFKGREAVLSYAIDVTERKRVEAALCESEQCFRKIFEDGPIAMGLAGLDRRILKANHAFCEILGYSDEEEVKKLTVVDITHPDDLDYSIKEFDRLIHGEIQHFQIEKKYLRKDRTIAFVRVTNSLIRDAQGTPAYILGIMEKIPELKNLEVFGVNKLEG